MPVSAVWSGVVEFSLAVGKIQSGMDEISRQLVATSLAIVERETKSMIGPESHKKGDPRVEVDHPNTVTGNLSKSITPSPVSREGNEFVGRIGPRAVYGRRVELGYAGGGGGRGHQKTRPFPYFTPGVEKSMPQIRELHRVTWAKYFGK